MSRVAWCKPMGVQWLGAVSARTALIGDSLAVGLTKPLTAEFGGGENFKAFAKGGTTVANWLTGDQAKSLDDALAFKPNTVLISLGTNDTKGKISEDAMKAQVKQLVGKIRAAGAEPIWLLPGTLPWPSNAIVVAVVTEKVVAIKQPDIPKQADKIHPTGAGYEMWAKQIYAELAAPKPSIVTGAKASIAPLVLVAAIVGLVWWAT